jgi:hypothetical protein
LDLGCEKIVGLNFLQFWEKSMGMAACFKALTPDEVNKITFNPDTAMDFIYSEDEESSSTADVDKAWHAIHYMLTGRAEGGEAPACLVIFGGIEVGEDLGYGPPRLLKPDGVVEAANLLEQITPAELAKRYDPKAMDAADIYPKIWVRDGNEGLEYVLEWYAELREFYMNARNRGDGVLQWLC